jgi:hypothetical protein
MWVTVVLREVWSSAINPETSEKLLRLDIDLWV